MKSTLLLAYLLVAFVPLAHATTVRADKLPPPKNMACLQVKQPIAYSLTRGLLHIPYDIQLGRGAYVSEREDANGVYYRAPEGAITERRTDVKEDSRAGRSITFDGGMYVPNDPAIAPTLYKYYATDSVVTQSVPDNTDCSMLAYAVDPNTQKVSVVATAIATGFGAAAGVVSGRFIHPHAHTSYGQAAGAGLAGGLIAGVIIAAIENSKVGEILPGPELDSQTSEKIKMLAANKAPVAELERAGDPNMAATAPALPAPAASTAQVPATQADANTKVQTMVAPYPPPAQAATTVVADAAMESLAQGVARQMGCGAVKANGEAAYIAPCGSYSLYIGCDAGQCRPLHTIKQESDN